MRALFIVGPTACGKSALAIECARRTDSEIISCDSMQIYRHMDIGTAKTSDRQTCGIPVHMTDIVEPDAEYSAYEYADEALRVAREVWNRGKLPIFAGGTGLYAHSTIFPLTFGAQKDERVRASLEQELSERGAEEMWRELARLDPEDAAKIHPNNTKRLLRALEIVRTGNFKPKGESLTPRFAVKMIYLRPPRDKLRRAIDDRVEAMFDAGLEREVKDLIGKRGLGFSMQSMQAIGYREFAPYLAGDISLAQLKENIKLDTRRYAKRQETWFGRYKFAIEVDPFALSLGELADIALSDDGYYNGEQNAEHR